MPNNLINDFILNLNKASEYDYDKVNIKNKYIERGYNILLTIDSYDNKIIVIKSIFDNFLSFDALKLLAGFLRKYEPSTSKKIYIKYRYDDPMCNLLLNNWEKDQIKIQEKFKTEIEKYNKWKEENKEEYEKTILGINELIDNL